MAEKPTVDEFEVMRSCLEQLQALSPGDQKRVLAWLSDKLKIRLDSSGPAPATGAAPGIAPPAGTSVAVLTAKAFLAMKKPQTNTERVTCLGFYLTYNRGLAHFKTADITKLNIEAAQSRLANATVAVNDAANIYHYLAAVGGGKKQITVRGEALVEALPDRDKVKAALTEHPIKRRQRTVAAPSNTKSKN